MKITDISIGASLFLDVERGNSYYTFPSKLYDITDKGIIVLSPFTMQSEITYLKERDVVYVREIKRGKLTRWLCDTVQEVMIKGGSYLFLKATSLGEDANRRSSYRLPVNCHAKVFNDKQLEKVELVDISLSGIGFIAESELKLRDTLDIEIIDCEYNVPLTVRVVRQVPTVMGVHRYGAIILKSNSILNKYFLAKQREEILRQKIITS